MLPPLSSIVPSPWPASRKAQQLAARPWLPCPWAGLSEPANDRARPQAGRSRGVASAALEHPSGSAARSLDSPPPWSRHRRSPPPRTWPAPPVPSPPPPVAPAASRTAASSTRPLWRARAAVRRPSAAGEWPGPAGPSRARPRPWVPV